jgi:hypothetical protein
MLMFVLQKEKVLPVEGQESNAEREAASEAEGAVNPMVSARGRTLRACRGFGRPAAPDDGGDDNGDAEGCPDAG